MMHHITIDPALLNIFPKIRLGCLTYRAQVADSNPALWAYWEASALPAVLRQIEEETLAGLEGIRSSREAYKAFGCNPSHYRVSSESLLRRIRQGHPLYRVNTVVDTSNVISMETALSVGSYDLQCLHGPITLREGKSGEGYEGIGKGFIDMEHMLLLEDASGPFGSPTSDSHRAMITANSSEILTLIYCFSDRIDLPAALKQAATQLEYFAAAAQMETWIAP